MQGKAAVFGEADFVMPFSTLGLDTYPVEAEREQASEKAMEILNKDYAMILVAENVASLVEEQFEPALKKASPCVVIIPFGAKSTGFAIEGLSRQLRLATGIDILRGE